MPTASTGGVIAVSINAEAATNSASSAEATESVVIELYDRFQKQQLPATWMVSDPIRHSLVGRIAGSNSHELALAIEATSHANQSPIAQLLQCRRAGLHITTIAENPQWRQRDVDLVAKHGITIIRGSTSQSGTHSIQGVRYGVWRVPICATLHGGGWMPYFAQLQRLRRALDRGIWKLGIWHACIDAPSIARADAAIGLRMVERFLAHLNHLKLARSIEVVTLRETVIRLQPKRTITAATSILRAA
ncbi:MAG: hypothetical protein IT427_06635 [Pirellulales bacterium]|nr:hypothetical protein [Pirellulales bacterium]